MSFHGTHTTLLIFPNAVQGNSLDQLVLFFCFLLCGYTVYIHNTNSKTNDFSTHAAIHQSACALTRNLYYYSIGIPIYIISHQRKLLQIIALFSLFFSCIWVYKTKARINTFLYCVSEPTQGKCRAVTYNRRVDLHCQIKQYYYFFLVLNLSHCR